MNGMKISVRVPKIFWYMYICRFKVKNKEDYAGIYIAKIKNMVNSQNGIVTNGLNILRANYRYINLNHITNVVKTRNGKEVSNLSQCHFVTLLPVQYTERIS